MASPNCQQFQHAAGYFIAKQFDNPWTQTEPFFLNEAESELGRSFDNAVWGGAPHTMVADSAKRTRPFPDPVMGIFFADWPNHSTFKTGRWRLGQSSRYRHHSLFSEGSYYDC
ncbi:hypothetical protein B0O99DRAFT_604618, partial [Bisporella sp. PMI_857]